MLVHKCDKCGKLIAKKDVDSRIMAGIGYQEREFCKRCGEPIARILKGFKLKKKFKKYK